MSDADFLVMKSREGLEERLQILFPDPQERALKRPEYDDRLQVELDVINQMGFPGYFLVVMEFIQWSKDNDIPVGPGRGSGAGSLVAYALKITDLDPLEFDLLFERFLNPERVSMPRVGSGNRTALQKQFGTSSRHHGRHQPDAAAGRTASV